MLSSIFPTRRCGRLLLLPAVLLPAIVIWSFWYAMNSDKDNIPPILTQLIPAGHATCQSSTVFECSSCLEPHTAYLDNSTSAATWQFEYPRDQFNEGLLPTQCSAAFPGLYEDITRAVTYWRNLNSPITLSHLFTIPLVNGMTLASIHNGKLYILSTKSASSDHRRKTLAVLSAMHRALTSSQDPTPLPDITFLFSIEDKATDIATVTPTLPLMVLARKASEQSLFLIPDFGFWSWDNNANEIGPFDSIASAAISLETSLPFSQKTPMLVWRGKLSFAPKLRRGLLDASRGQPWSDVKELEWSSPASHFLSLPDHCRYKFIAHVEGRSYSASLKYRFACESVVVAHELQYIQHHHYLLVREGESQNYVEVRRDFADLGEKMEGLIGDEGKAERIAGNARKTFRERYLTNAAEACYWRRLWRGYAQVYREEMEGEGRGEGRRGLRYETFLLMESGEMMDFEARS